MSSFNLSKGTAFNLSKAAPGIEIAGIGLGWNENADPHGPVFDLDVSAFCLGEDGQIPEMTDFVFYGSTLTTQYEGESDKRPYSTDGSVLGAIDEIGGGDDDDDGDGDGDQEEMRIYFDRVADHIKSIVIIVTITKYPNDELKDKRTLDLNMSQVSGTYGRIWNESTGEELCRYTLNEDFANEDAVEIGRFERNQQGEWDFIAMGQGYEGGIHAFIKKYAKNF